jgi:nitrile hydratase subunit beta
MKLQHHLGGLEGLGTPVFQKRVFVEAWEERIFGIHVAMMALSNHLDKARPKYLRKQCYYPRRVSGANKNRVSLNCV